jgi:hypothetical protein
MKSHTNAGRSTPAVRVGSSAKTPKGDARRFEYGVFKIYNHRDEVLCALRDNKGTLYREYNSSFVVLTSFLYGPWSPYKPTMWDYPQASLSLLDHNQGILEEVNIKDLIGSACGGGSAISFRADFDARHFDPTVFIKFNIHHGGSFSEC